MGRYWRQLSVSPAIMLKRFTKRTGPRPFVILFVPRTGSNLLAGMLDTHPDVLCHHELFLPGSPPHRSLSVREGAIDLDLGGAEERDRDPVAFLSRVFGLDMGRSAVGFKLALSDPNVGVLLGLILNRSVRKIVVRRDNWLHVYTSALIAEQTHSLIRFSRESPGAPDPGPVRVNVDVARFRAYARKRRLAYGALRWIARLTGQRFHELEYEEIKDPVRLNGLLAYLGVSQNAELRERTVKQNPSRLEDRIDNFAEVRRQLRGTRYEAYLAG